MLGSVSFSNETHAAVPTLRARAQCQHCGNALPSPAQDSFCCHGCRAVHQLLSAAGMTRYYDLRSRVIAPPALMAATGRTDRNWLEPLLAQLRQADSHIELAIKLQGLRCAACVWLIQELFGRQPGSQRISINSARGNARLCVTREFPLTHFVAELESFGYLAGDIGETDHSDDDLLLRTGVCLALSANAMMFSAAIYLGLHDGPLYSLLHALNFGCATLAVLVGGPVFISSAWAALRRRILHLDLPIATGIVLSYCAALWSFTTGHAGAAYYDSLATFIALMLLGRWLKERILTANRRELLTNAGLETLLVRRVQDGSVALIPATCLQAGDELIVPPGDLVPVAGTLIASAAACSLDWINGESEPLGYAQGSVVPAGAFNAGAGALRLRCETDFAGSKLVELLAQSQLRELPQSSRTHAFSLAYVLVVLGAGAAAFVYWWLRAGSVTRGLEVATAIYVVTCPCAIGIAVPLAEELVLTGLRRAGLFVRSSSFLDRALSVRVVVFDKTGTLTTGRLHVEDERPLRELADFTRDVLYTMAAVSGHPKSTALVRALDSSSPKLLRDVQVTESPGLGTEATIDGKVYRLGQPRWVSAASGAASDLAFGVDGRVLCNIQTRETLRDDASAEVAGFVRDGFEVFMLSGDDTERVSVLAKELDIPADHALGRATPADKAAFIAAHDQSNLLMIGDGVNDTLAVAAAYTSGTPSIDRAVMPSRTDFYFVTPGLAPIRLALRAAQRLARVLRRNQIFAVSYNLLVVTVAICGWMKPWLAAVLMPLSSLFVLSTTSLSLAARSSLWKF